MTVGCILTPPLVSALGAAPERGCPQPQHVRKGVGLEILVQRCVFGAAAAGDSRAPVVVPRYARDCQHLLAGLFVLHGVFLKLNPADIGPLALRFGRSSSGLAHAATVELGAQGLIGAARANWAHPIITSRTGAGPTASARSLSSPEDAPGRFNADRRHHHIPNLPWASKGRREFHRCATRTPRSGRDH